METELASTPIYWGGHTEEYLSTFQKHQGVENDSGAYAAAAAISLLREGRKVDYTQVARASNRWTAMHTGLLIGIPGLIFGKGRRLWPGGPMTPKQQASLVEWLGKSRRFTVQAKAIKQATAKILIANLQQPDTLQLVTVSWTDSTRPQIVHPDGSLMGFPLVGAFPGNVDHPFESLVMVLVAYDPTRTVESPEGALPTPWGLLNWWIDGHITDVAGYGHLHWMPDEDFRLAWGFNLPLIGSNNVVVVTRKN